METVSALLALCAGNSPVPGEFPAWRAVTRCFDIFFDLCLNKRFSKQSWGWWFETLSCPLWRHCNVISQLICVKIAPTGLGSLHWHTEIVQLNDFIGSSDSGGYRCNWPWPNITKLKSVHNYLDGWAEDCSNSRALTPELLQSCTKPLIGTYVWCGALISLWIVALSNYWTRSRILNLGQRQYKTTLE